MGSDIRKSATALLVASVLLAYATESVNGASFLLAVSPYYFFVSVILLFSIIVLFWAVLGRVTPAFIITFLLVLLLSCVSYFKYAARGEPLYFGDLSLAFTIGGVANRSNIIITPYIIAAVVTGVLAAAGLFMLRRPKLLLWKRCVLLLVSVLALSTAYAAQFSRWSDRTNPDQGFVTGFLSSMGPNRDTWDDGAWYETARTDDYQDETADINATGATSASDATGASDVSDADGSSESKSPQDYIGQELERVKSGISRTYDPSSVTDSPDVIILLSESFWDITQIDALTLSEDPIPNFKQISEESVSGQMISYTYGGGTSDVEFELLTGYLNRFLDIADTAYQSYVDKDIFTIAEVFKQAGYSAEAVHTYERTFFDRDKAIPHMGFESWTGLEDLENPEYDGRFVSDKTLMDEIINRLESGDAPRFIFAISMENHQAYSKDKYDETDIKVLNEDIDAELRSNIEIYVHGLHHADEQLGRLVEYLKTRERPTALLYFGDHQPSLGSDFGLYRYAGEIADGQKRSPEEYKKLLTTRFLIWSNYKNETGYVEAIGENFLGSYFLDYLNMPKPLYYYFLDDVYENYFHALSRREMYLDINNKPHNTFTPELQRVFALYRVLQGYMLSDSGAVRDELIQFY